MAGRYFWKYKTLQPDLLIYSDFLIAIIEVSWVISDLSANQ